MYSTFTAGHLVMVNAVYSHCSATWRYDMHATFTEVLPGDSACTLLSLLCHLEMMDALYFHCRAIRRYYMHATFTVIPPGDSACALLAL